MIAFYESGLEAVTIGKNVTELGDGAFGGCHNLQSVTVAEENRKYVAEDGVVFSADRTALYIFPAGRSGSYTVPGTVVQIVPYAFAGASDLTNIPESRRDFIRKRLTAEAAKNNPSLLNRDQKSASSNPRRNTSQENTCSEFYSV